MYVCVCVYIYVFFLSMDILNNFSFRIRDIVYRQTGLIFFKFMYSLLLETFSFFFIYNRSII